MNLNLCVLGEKCNNYLKRKKELKHFKSPKKKVTHHKEVTKIKSLKASKSEPEYSALQVQKTFLRKTRSLDCLTKTTKNRNTSKRYSLGNDISLQTDENFSIDEFNTQMFDDNINFHNINVNNDRKIINLMEEDCLANIENEFCGNKPQLSVSKSSTKTTFNDASTSNDKNKNRKHESSFSWRNKSNSSDVSEPGWSRMKVAKKNDQKGKKLKQLNISTFSTKENKTNKNENKITTRSALRENVSTTEKEPQKPPLLEKRASFKLDQFEAYLQENITESLNDVDESALQWSNSKLNFNQKDSMKKSVEESELIKKKNINVPNTKVDKIRNDNSTTNWNRRQTRSIKEKKETVLVEMNPVVVINNPKILKDVVDAVADKNIDNEDIFTSSTQKLGESLKNSPDDCAALASNNLDNLNNIDDTVFQIATQKLNLVIERPYFENNEADEIIHYNNEIRSPDAKKRKTITNDNLDLIKVWSPISAKNDNLIISDMLIAARTENTNNFIVEAQIHKSPNHEIDPMITDDNIETSDNRIKNKPPEEYIEELKALQSDVLKNNEAVQEMLSFLSNSRSLFSSISQEKYCENKIDSNINSSKNIVQSLPTLTHDKKVVDFYNTAIPHLNNLRKLYSDFKPIVNDITINMKMLSDVFGKHSQAINTLVCNKDKNITTELPSTISVNLADLTYTKINPKMDACIQTESEIKCPKCYHIYNFKLPICTEKETNGVNLDIHHSFNDKFFEENESILIDIENVSSIKQIEKNISKYSSNSNIVQTDVSKKVNRQLKFVQNIDKKFKRIRTQSSDSDESDVGVHKKVKSVESSDYDNDIDIIFLSEMSEKHTKMQDNSKVHKPENPEEAQIQKLLDNYKKPEINRINNIKNVTQDVELKYMSLLEREYKELDRAKVRRPETIINKQPDNLEKPHNSFIDNLVEKKLDETVFNTENSINRNNETLSNQIISDSEHANSYHNSILDNLLGNKNETIKNTILETSKIYKNVETQLSKSLFSESEKLYTVSNKTSVEKEQLSMSMFTDNIDKNATTDGKLLTNKKAGMDNNVDVLNNSLNDIFEDKELDQEVEMHLSNQSIADSLDGYHDDIFADVNIVESTPQKDKSIHRLQHKLLPAIDELPKVLTNETLNTVISELNFENTEVLHIPPPPEFQDVNEDKIEEININMEQNKTVFGASSLTPDFLSLSSGSTNQKNLNERIDVDLDNFHSSFNKMTTNDVNQSLNNISIRNINRKKNDSYVDTSFTHVSPTARNESFKSKTLSRNLNPISLVQKDLVSPLTIVKTTTHVPKTVLTTTPKQRSILNYVMTPTNKLNNESMSSSHSICLTPHVRNTANISFEDTMELTPVEDKQIIPHVRPSPKKQICITCTRLSKDENMKVIEMTSRYNLLFSKQFSNNVTHLVVLVDNRNRIKDHTMKYVASVANGIWIVSFTWVQECLNHGRIVSEEPYEVLDVSGIAGPRRSRLTRKTNLLLKNFAFYCAEPFLSVTRNDLESVVTNLGAANVHSLDDLKKKEGKILLILTEAKISQDFDQYQIWLESLQIITVDIEWLSRSVGQYQLCSIRPFMLCLDDGIENFGYPSYLIAAVPETLTEITVSSTVRH